MAELLGSTLSAALSPIFIYFTLSTDFLHKSIPELMNMLLVTSASSSIWAILLFEIVIVMLLSLFLLVGNDRILLHYYPIKNLRASIDMYPRLYFSKSLHGSKSSIQLPRSRSSSLSISHKKTSHTPFPALAFELYRLDAFFLKYTSVVYRFISATIISLTVLVLRLTTSSVSGLEFNVARTFGPSMECHLQCHH